MAIHQLCTIPMGENLIEHIDHNQSSIYVYSSTAHEYSIANQYHILANTSTLAGGYTIINMKDSIPLPSLTFDDSPTHYEPIACNKQIHHISPIDKSTSSSTSSHTYRFPTYNDDQIITNIDFIYSI